MFELRFTKPLSFNLQRFHFKGSLGGLVLRINHFSFEVKYFSKFFSVLLQAVVGVLINKFVIARDF